MNAVFRALYYESAGYQDAVDFYNNYAEENGIVYYNLNYLKGREEIFPDSVMHDDNHLNGEGWQQNQVKYMLKF